MFYAAPNTVTKTVSPCLPWEFIPAGEISEQIRHNKEDRQNWYKSKDTKHCFYTGIEAISKTQRVSKENPPKAIWAFPADYDIKIPPERILEAIRVMKVKPTYFETSLGGNFRLVWILEVPIQVDSAVFARFILQQAHNWLQLDLLPGLDRPAFEEVSRLYCNGCAWEKLNEPVPAATVQAFFVECGKAFRFKAGDDGGIPLDIVEKALHEKYPGFSWPNEFVLESMGPSFWITDSVSTQSAIVKEGGMFTFAAHADRPFYTWTDLLGKEFTDKFQQDAIAKATEDIWWDGKNFHKKEQGIYSPQGPTEMDSYLRVTCRLSSKAGQSGISPLSSAYEHIYRHQRVTGAAPFVFVRPGLITHDGERKLNTYSGQPMQPAGDGTEKWGSHGNFPFFSLWMDTFWNPTTQWEHFLSGWKIFYESALNFDPHPGQNYFLLGPVGCGKTLLNRFCVGASVGGYVDASDYIVNGATFNSHLFRRGLWVIDDESPAGSNEASARTHMMFKKVAANQQQLCNGKYLLAIMLDWMGRIGCTANLDYVSTRIVGALDNSSMDKTNLYRCATSPDFVFPNRTETKKLLDAEMPHVLRFIVDYKIPDHITRDSRYGIAAHHEKTLLDKTFQSSPTASFKEVVIEFLIGFFNANKDEQYWEGTVSMLLTALYMSPGNEVVLKSVRLDQASRFLEQISREGTLRSEVVQGKYNTRLWRFYRLTDDKPNS